MRDADRHLVVFASQRDVGLVRFDSEDADARRDRLVTFAVRASMNIPGYFKPPTEQGQSLYDGGLQANFPLKEWISLYPDRPFMGIYLGPKVTDPTVEPDLAKDVLGIVTTRDDYPVIAAHRDHVVMVDPSPIGMTEFGLGQPEMDFLVLEGRASALEHVARTLNDNQVEALAQAARAKAAAAHAVVSGRKARKRRNRRSLFAAIATAAVAGLAWLEWA